MLVFAFEYRAREACSIRLDCYLGTAFVQVAKFEAKKKKVTLFQPLTGFEVRLCVIIVLLFHRVPASFEAGGVRLELRKLFPKLSFEA